MQIVDKGLIDNDLWFCICQSELPTVFSKNFSLIQWALWDAGFLHIIIVDAFNELSWCFLHWLFLNSILSLRICRLYVALNDALNHLTDKYGLTSPRKLISAVGIILDNGPRVQQYDRSHLLVLPIVVILNLS
jgi:hypothetical protein